MIGTEFIVGAHEVADGAGVAAIRRPRSAPSLAAGPQPAQRVGDPDRADRSHERPRPRASRRTVRVGGRGHRRRAGCAHGDEDDPIWASVKASEISVIATPDRAMPDGAVPPRSRSTRWFRSTRNGFGTRCHIRRKRCCGSASPVSPRGSGRSFAPLSSPWQGRRSRVAGLGEPGGLRRRC